MATFSIKTKFEPVVIVGDDDVEVTYKLCQLTGEQADNFRASQAAKVELDKDGNVTKFNDFTGQFTDLLCRCLKGPDGVLVAKAVLNTWPDETLQELHKAALKLNKMDKSEDGETDPKKS
jgi:hypothetical protein